MSQISDFPPDIRGAWNHFLKALRVEAPNEKPSFENFKFQELIALIEQQDEFVIVTIPPNLPLRPEPGYWVGYWCKIYNSDGTFDWQLTMSDYDDNGVYVARVAEYTNGKVSKLVGYYNESGFSCCGNKAQLPTVAGWTFTRVTYK